VKFVPLRRFNRVIRLESPSSHFTPFPEETGEIERDSEARREKGKADFLYFISA